MKILKTIKKELFLFVVAIALSNFLVPIFYVTFSLKYFAIIQSNIDKFGHFPNLQLLLSSEIARHLFFFCISFAGMQALHLISSFVLSIGLPGVNDKLKKMAFDEVITMPIKEFKNKNAADIEKNVTNFAESACNFLDFAFFLLGRLIQLFTCMFLFLKNREIFVGAFGWISIVIFICSLFFRVLNRLAKEKSEAQNKQSGFISEVFDNILVLKTTNCNTYIDNKYKNHQAVENSKYKKLNVLFGINRFVFGNSNIGFFSVNVLLSLFFRNGTNPSVFFAQFWSMALLFWEIMWSILPFFNIIGKFVNSYNFLKGTIKEHQNLKEVNTFDLLEIIDLNVKFRENQIFHNFNMTLKNQERSFILIEGPSGIGKTTLFNVILGLEKTENVKINSIPIDQIANKEKIISYLPQKDMIFNDSIINNITLEKDYNEEKLEKIINILKMGDLYHNEKNRMCGTSGSLISGGQAKRIALARMLLFDENNKILLIDEPFNNLSDDIIESIMIFLKSLKGKRTVICIDHTGKFKEIADKVITLKQNQ